MSKPIRVDGDSLRALDACEDQVQTFEAEWSDGVVVTRPVLMRAAELRLALDWWFRAAYPARDAEWRAKRAPIDAEYDAKRAPIDAEWRAKRAPIDAEWRAKRDALIADLLGLEVTKEGE